MKQAFLNEPSLVEARDVYLHQHWLKPFTQQAWGGRRPTQKQFDKKFGEAYETRQRYLTRRSNTVVAERTANDFQELFEAFAEYVGSQVEEPETPSPRANVVPKSENRPPYVGKSVLQENLSKPPTADQMTFYIHRAREAGKEFATVPVNRGIAAEGIGLIKDGGLSYLKAIKLLKSQ